MLHQIGSNLATKGQRLLPGHLAMKKALPVGRFEIDLKTGRRDHIIAHCRKNCILYSGLLASQRRSVRILRIHPPHPQTQQEPAHAIKNPLAYLL